MISVTKLLLNTEHFGDALRCVHCYMESDATDPILSGLKDRRKLLKGRCAACRYLDFCNGNFRTRAEAVTGDFWESDPACYLTDEEIGLV